MSKLALGLIETIGLVAAIEVADIALKSANVSLIGYELAKGDGMVAVKIQGDVGAVKAAIDAAKGGASKIGTIVSVLVIPRPAENLESILYTRETVGLELKEEIVEELLTEQEIVEEAVEEKVEEEILDVIEKENTHDTKESIDTNDGKDNISEGELDPIEDGDDKKPKRVRKKKASDAQ